MDSLLNPDTGLMVWTVVTFLSLVFLLGKFAWGPLLRGIEAREARMKADLEGAQEARAGAEKIRSQLEAEMAAISAKSQDLLKRATQEGETLRLELKRTAESEAAKIKEKTLAELEEEKRRLKGELRAEVASLSVMAAEKLLRRSVDDAVQKEALESFFKDVGGRKNN